MDFFTKFEEMSRVGSWDRHAGWRSKIGTKKIIWKDHWSIHLEVLLWYDFTQYFFTWKAEWREEGELGKKFFSRKKKKYDSRQQKGSIC